MHALVAVLGIPVRSIRESFENRRKNKRIDRFKGQSNLATNLTTSSAPATRAPSKENHHHIGGRVTERKHQRAADRIGPKGRSQSLGSLPFVGVSSAGSHGLSNLASSRVSEGEGRGKGKGKGKEIEEVLPLKQSVC